MQKILGATHVFCEMCFHHQSTTTPINNLTIVLISKTITLDDNDAFLGKMTRTSLPLQPCLTLWKSGQKLTLFQCMTAYLLLSDYFILSISPINAVWVAQEHLMAQH
jgi:hypothetical protein